MTRMLNILSIAIISLSLLSACDRPKTEKAETEKNDAPYVAKIPDIVTSDYECGTQQITFSTLGGDKGDLKVKNVSYAMQSVVSASGAKYNNLGDDKTIFWSKGDTAFVTLDGKELPECKLVVKEPKVTVIPKALSEIGNVVWVLEDINNTGVIDYSHGTLEFGKDGRIHGNSGCNLYGASYTLDKGVLKISPNMVSTMRACTSPAMQQQEQRFTKGLIKGTKLELKETGALIMTADDGSTLRFMPE